MVKGLKTVGVCVAAFAMAACGSGGDTETADSSGPALNVGYSAPGLIDSLQKTWADTVCATVEDAGGECQITDAQSQLGKQISDVDDLIAKGVTYLVINPVDEQGIAPAIAKAKEAGIPVFTVDNGAASPDVVARVKFDNFGAGKQSAEYCAEQHDGEGAVLELQGKAGSDNVRQRHEGFVEGLMAYPDMQLIASPYTDWDAGKALAATEDALAAHPDIVCIYSHADAIILGAVEALQAANKTDVDTFGIGMYGGGPEAIEAGTLTASWYLDPEQVGKEAGKAVVDYWKGKDVKELISTPITFVTKDNVDQFPGSS